jgi:4-hydroxy-tetrahydrodipicolinate synthase
MYDAFRQGLTGIHAATVVPMRTDFSIDEEAVAQHIGWVAGTPGIRGLLVNGHAGENFVLDRAEKRRVVEIATQVSPEGCLIVSGVNAESSLDAAKEAAEMEAAGADGLLVFPPNSWALSHAEEAVFLHHRYIADATSLPLLLYGAPIASGTLAYPPGVLSRLAEEPRIVGIKEGSWEVAAYEANMRLLKAQRPDFIVLGSGDEHLLTSYLIGTAGSQVSLAAVVPDLVASLWQAAASGDWTAARAVHERLYPLAAAIYRDPPGGRATARLKAGLKILGRLTSDAVRPPQSSATADEYRAVEKALAQVT